MRPLVVLAVVLTAVATANSAFAGGFIVFKDLRTHGVVELRDGATGRVVSSTVDIGDKTAPGTACGDSRHTFFGARWQTFERYLVNVSSVPSHVDDSAALADIKAAHKAWQAPFVSDCTTTPTKKNPYRALYGGQTTLQASLGDGLTVDGVNVIAFRSLVGTVCDGALACVVVDARTGRITEADMLFEHDLTRFGFEDYWTTDDTTWFDSVGGEVSISDTATHEFGHFAGLGHANRSPELTMFPFIIDGAQTLGLGDMKGLVARYQ